MVLRSRRPASPKTADFLPILALWREGWWEPTRPSHFRQAETLDACVGVAADFGAGVHIHVAEDDSDQVDSQVRFGVGVVERLASAGVPDERALLAHCVHLNGHEAALIDQSGATVAHNTRSNMNNGVGRSFMGDRVGRVALGTYGIGADMFAEVQAEHFAAREAGIDGAPELRLARLAEGSRLAGSVFGEQALGSLVPGAPADITVLDYATPTPVTTENLGDHWVFGLQTARACDVVLAGQLVLADGHSTRVDEHKVDAERRYESERVWARLRQIPIHEFEPQKGRRP